MEYESKNVWCVKCTEYKTEVNGGMSTVELLSYGFLKIIIVGPKFQPPVLQKYVYKRLFDFVSFINRGVSLDGCAAYRHNFILNFVNLKQLLYYDWYFN